MVDHLNSRKIFWNNTGLDLEFGASWGEIENGENLHHTLGQLSWLSEQSCATHNVLAPRPTALKPFQGKPPTEC